jgi:hypothetical protein
MHIQHKPNPGIDPDWLLRKCLDAAPFVPYIWRTKTPIRFPGSSHHGNATTKSHRTPFAPESAE